MSKFLACLALPGCSRGVRCKRVSGWSLSAHTVRMDYGVWCFQASTLIQSELDTDIFFIVFSQEKILDKEHEVIVSESSLAQTKTQPGSSTTATAQYADIKKAQTLTTVTPIESQEGTTCASCLKVTITVTIWLVAGSSYMLCGCSGCGGG